MLDIASLISTLGFPIAVVCYLLWERRCQAHEVRKERGETLLHLEKVIKNDLVHAIDELRVEIVKLNERCNRNKKGEGGC
jgi:DNA-directed RNA polymerase subunit F